VAKDPSKTEKATGKRREETRKKGQVAKSMEVTSVAILIASLIFFYFGTTRMLLDLMDIMKATFRVSSQTTINSDNIQALLSGYVIKVFMLLWPLLLTLGIAGFLANVFQVGLKITPEVIKPQLSKMNPINGLKNLVSVQALAQLVKSIIKITVVGIVVYIVVRNELANVFPLADQSIWGIMVYIGEISFKIIMNTCWVLLLLAILDYAFQKWQFEESIKMTKQEVKDEQRQIEGDPAVRGKIRSLQRQAARRRMMAAVPKADVVITNPTHIAVALQYEQHKMMAPVVVAKGTGVIAERIKAIAEENDVPVVENKPVAQLLYKIVDIDEEIPENLYKAVAETLAYVYGLKEKANRI
jgi:flagellar biosynthesis protein FlhB